LDIIGTKVLRVFLLAIHSHLYCGFYSPPPLRKSGLKLVCNVNIVYENLMSENSQDYAQRPQQNYTFINSASETSTKLYVHEFGFCVHKSNRILIRGNGDVHPYISSLALREQNLQLSKNKHPGWGGWRGWGGRDGGGSF
jgi:hypothetical protein